jgi:large subunit ribosomal protein L2
MAVKRRKPRTPGQRHVVRRVRKEEGGSQRVPKVLRTVKKEWAGRNQTGRITVRHRGAGCKRLRRERNRPRRERWTDVRGVVAGIQYDPNRTGYVALVRVVDGSIDGRMDGVIEGDAKGAGTRARVRPGSRYYTIATTGRRVGDVVYVRPNRERRAATEVRTNGSTLTRGSIPVGRVVCWLERQPGSGGTYVRAAGTSGLLLQKEDKHVVVRLPSGTLVRVSSEATAVLGSVAGEDHALEVRGKAGTSRRLGIRPTVRGDAMNPVDHPHGGRTRGGRRERTPWSRRAKGKPTRRSTKVSRWVVKPS